MTTPDPTDYDEDAEAEINCHLGADGYCGAAGTEWCDWDCPFNRPQP